MTTYPYTKNIIISSDDDDDNPNNISITLNRDQIFSASRCLTPSGFKLYIYLILNESGTELALSRADVCDKMNMGSSSYTNAVNELLEKQYLIPIGGNSFIFSGKRKTRSLKT